MTELLVFHEFITSGLKEREIQRKLIEIFDVYLSNYLIEGRNLKLIGEEVSVGLRDGVDRKIDLLAITNMGELVIIELKRGGDHLQELQAFRYGLLMQRYSKEDLIVTFQRFKSRLYELGFTSDLPSNQSAREELERFTCGADFDMTKRKFSIVLLAAEFHAEVIYSCRKLSELNFCDAHCVLMITPNESSLKFDKSEILDRPVDERIRITKTLHDAVLSQDDMFTSIADPQLRMAFINLVNKHPRDWYPVSRLLSINGPKNSHGRQVNWRIKITGKSLNFRQNHLVTESDDSNTLRSIGIDAISERPDKYGKININGTITSADVLLELMRRFNL